MYMHTGLQFNVKSINESYSKYASTLRDIVQIPNNRCLYIGLEFHLEFYLEFGRSQFINSLSVFDNELSNYSKFFRKDPSHNLCRVKHLIVEFVSVHFK